MAPASLGFETAAMALKATIHKAQIQLSDMDRNVYCDHSVTIARHPSETDERLMVRILALALNAPSSQDESPLELAKDMWEPDEPSLWQKDATGRVILLANHAEAPPVRALPQANLHTLRQALAGIGDLESVVGSLE